MLPRAQHLEARQLFNAIGGVEEAGMNALRTNGSVASITAALTLMLAGSAVAQENKYLIVSAPDYVGSAALTEFIAFRTSRGYEVSVYNVPAGTSREDIKAYIESLWGTPDAPDYLLIVGDTSGAASTSNTIPHWVGAGTRQAPTDLPYACMDGPGDWYPDMYYGRFSVTSPGMLQQVVDKIIRVESGDFPDPSYLRRAAMLATDDPTAEAAALHDSIISTYLEPAGFSATRIYAGMGGSTADIAAAVNAGVLFTVYFGHSGTGGWSSPGFWQANVNALTNDGLYGLTMGWSCNSARFDQDECYGETWLRAANKGSAAYLSASAGIPSGSATAWDCSWRMERYFFQSLFEDDIHEVGRAWQQALWKMLDDPDYGPGHSETRNIFDEMVLLGDPALRLPIRSLALSLPDGCPEYISPQAPTPIRVRIENVCETYEPGTGLLHYRFAGGAYLTTPLTPLGDGLYQALLPAPRCSAVPEFYFSATGHLGGPAKFPRNAPATVLTATVATVTTLLDDDFETARGWSVWIEPTMESGFWQRTIPASQPLPGAPAADFDGSGRCYVTDNRVGNYDVDGGPTRITSAAFDLSGMTDVRVCYARWIYCDDYSGPDQDFLEVEFSSDNGATWVPVEQVSDLGGWVKREIAVQDYVPLTAQFRVRFSISDTPNNSVTEAAVDDVLIYDLSCHAPPLPGDLNCDDAVNAFDIDPFILVLTGDPTCAAYYAAFPNCDHQRADCNGDGEVNVFDIDAFVTLLMGASGACCDDATGICADYVAPADCMTRYALGEQCSDLEPVCGNPGACCDDVTGECLDYIFELLCTGRFAGGVLCADLAPQCAPCADAELMAPGSWSGNTCGAVNDCAMRPSQDLIVQVEIPTAGSWTFDLCAGTTVWDTYLYVGHACCTSTWYNDDGCPTGAALSTLSIASLPAGVYYATIEAYSSACGPVTLTVSTGTADRTDASGAAELMHEN